jgi:hypothetical protein
MSKRLVLQISESLLYVVASLAFFYCFYVFAADLQDFSHLFTMLPFYIAFLLPIHILIAFHLILYPVDFKRLRWTYLANGGVIAFFAFLSWLFTIVNLAKGTYQAGLTGYITPLFPWDVFLLGLVYMGLGAFWIVKGWKLKESDGELFFFPRSKSKLHLVFASIFRPLYVIISLYFTGAFLFSLGIANYGGAKGWAMASAELLMLFLVGQLALYEWGYKARPSQERSLQKSKKMSLWTLDIGLVLVAYFVISLVLAPDFLIEEATNLFPVDFMGSYKLAPYFLVLPSLIAPLSAFLTALLSARKANPKA